MVRIGLPGNNFATLVPDNPGGMTVTRVTRGTSDYARKGDFAFMLPLQITPRGLLLSQLVVYKQIPYRTVQPEPVAPRWDTRRGPFLTPSTIGVRPRVFILVGAGGSDPGRHCCLVAADLGVMQQGLGDRIEPVEQAMPLGLGDLEVVFHMAAVRAGQREFLLTQVDGDRRRLPARVRPGRSHPIPACGISSGRRPLL